MQAEARRDNDNAGPFCRFHIGLFPSLVQRNMPTVEKVLMKWEKGGCDCIYIPITSKARGLFNYRSSECAR